MKITRQEKVSIIKDIIRDADLEQSRGYSIRGVNYHFYEIAKRMQKEKDSYSVFDKNVDLESDFPELYGMIQIRKGQRIARKPYILLKRSKTRPYALTKEGNSELISDLLSLQYSISNNKRIVFEGKNPNVGWNLKIFYEVVRVMIQGLIFTTFLIAPLVLCFTYDSRIWIFYPVFFGLIILEDQFGTDAKNFLKTIFIDKNFLDKRRARIQKSKTIKIREDE